MKKLLLALPLVAGGAWAGSTYYAGSQAQPAYEKLVAELNTAASQALVLEVAEYNAGFTQSTALTNVMVHGYPDQVLFQLKHDIQHTPIGSDPEGARFSASSITTTLAKAASDAGEFDELFQHFDGGQPFVLYTDVGFTGDTTSDLQISAANWAEDEAGSVSFAGGRFNITAIGDKVDVHGVLGAFDLTNSDNGAVITIAESTTNLDLFKVGKGVYTGNQSVVFPSMALTDETGGYYSVSDIVFDTVSSLVGDTIDSTMEFSVAQIESPMPVSSASWEMGVRGVPLEALEDYIEAVGDLEQLIASEAGMDALFKAYSGLIAPGVKFDNKLTVNNEGGDIVADVKFSFIGDGSADGLSLVSTVGDLIETVSVNVILDADAAAIDMTPAAMFMMHPMAQQYIIASSDKYSSNIHVANLMLDINGNMQPIRQLLGDGLDEPVDFLSLVDDY